MKIPPCFAVLTLTMVLLCKNLAARKPNVVFILADDLGWAELGCYGNSFNETPHLDRLAEEGLRFTHAYAAAPVCSPYRAALLTGQHPARVGILDYLRPNSSNALPVSQITLPEMFKRNGYRTGMVGKWHLTGYKYQNAQFEVRPNDHGFDWNIGSEIKGVGNGANFWPYVFRTQPISWIDLPKNRMGKKEYLTDRLNLEAVDFVERNQDKPFFLYLSHYAPHTILNGRPDLVEKYRKKHPPGKPTRTKCYLCDDAGLKGEDCEYWAQDHNPHLAAMLETIDDGVGLLMKKLDSLGLSENTIIIFSSDNGGETNVTTNDPLRGGKSQLYEGGIRVPLIIRWPGGKIPSGRICEQPVVNHDFYPTLLEAAKIEPDPSQHLDGISVFNTLQNPKRALKRKTLHWHYPLDRPHFLGGVSSGAIRSGNWKLIEYFDPMRPEKFELFNLGTDVSEERNLASTEPKRVRELHRELVSWRQWIGARIAARPLLVHPGNLIFGEHFSMGQISPNWFFQKEWQVVEGVLKRNELAGENKRLFYKDPHFRDALVRFEFRFDEAKEIRLVTGSHGHYNTVLHIRRDHFFLQTARDSRGPWFSMRHGECAFDFQPGKWYLMTLEFREDLALARIDHQRLAFARHPVINQDRTYFALQVDTAGAAFDNLQVFGAGKHADFHNNLSFINELRGKFPVRKSIEKEYLIRKNNLHARLYMEDSEYRELVEKVTLIDLEKMERFPLAFRSNKDIKKEIQERRRILNREDSAYKELLHATHRAHRALDQFVLEREPSIDRLPASNRESELENARLRLQTDPEYKKLNALFLSARQKLEGAHPELFLTDQSINLSKKEAREAIKKDPLFRELNHARAEAYSNQQNYLLESDPKLQELKEMLQL